VSFISRRNLRLFEKSISLRRELTAFLLLVTLWTLAVGVFSNMAFTVYSDQFQWWAQRNRMAATILLSVALAGLAYAALMALTSGVIGVLQEVRRFHILLPLMISADRVEAIPIAGYWITDAIRGALLNRDQGALLEACRESIAAQAGRPFTDRFFEILANAVGGEMVSGLAKSCEFLLSAAAEFHGLDYGELASPPGPCKKVGVSGLPGASLRLPHRCKAAVEQAPPDRYGKRTPRIRMDTPYGKIRFSTWPQWAILSEGYHGLSLDFAKTRLQTGTRPYSDRDCGKLPTLWVLEIPVEIRADFSGGWRPYVFLGSRFELFASWVCDALDRAEQAWSWEAFVDRGLGAPADDA
jgi:hypothetical protein